MSPFCCCAGVSWQLPAAHCLQPLLGTQRLTLVCCACGYGQLYRVTHPACLLLLPWCCCFQVLGVMSKRIVQNKIIMFGIVAFLLAAIFLIIYVKLK